MLVFLSEGVSLFYSRYLAALPVKPITLLSLTAGGMTSTDGLLALRRGRHVADKRRR
jgi:hypothetical protein